MDFPSGSARMFGEPKQGGILRVDINKPRRSSGSSVEFRSQPERLGQDLYEGIGPASPQPSVDRLSVTWADVEDSSTKLNFFTPGTPPATSMEVRFPDSQNAEAEASEDEDYSASVSAIMQRRASTRRSRRAAGRGRRASSPFGVPDGVASNPSGTGARRRSSAFTVSSGETAISMEDTPQEVTQEQIYENIRLHKEVLGSVKQQPWGMRRKLRLVNQAKAYIKRHEGALQERLAQSKCTRDIVARFNILLATRLQRLKREVANISNWLIPWELRIKEIESHFGSVVASYFTFLRWLFWVNLVISIVLIVFVVVPEILTADLHAAGERKEMLPEEKNKSTNLLTLWEFEGILKYSPIFYGYYTNRDPGEKGGYRLPLAYFMTGLAVYIYSFVATLRKMAENSRMSKLSEKEDECIFSWKLFTGWDYMIGNAETSHNRTASIILGFKEALLEEAEKKKVLRNWKIIIQRGIVNICVLFLLGVSAYAVVEVVRRSNEPEAETSWWRQNEITIVMSLISYIFPNFFDILGLMESYHPRRQLRIQLARIMLLNLLNLYSLIIALFAKITDMTKELERLKPSDLTTTIAPLLSTTTTTAAQISTLITEPATTSYEPPITTLAYEITETLALENVTYCFNVQVNCSSPKTPINLTAALMTVIIANVTSFSTTTPYDFTTTPYDLTTNNNYISQNTVGSTDYYDFSSTDINDSFTTYPSSSVSIDDIYQNFTSTESQFSSSISSSSTEDNIDTPGPNETYYDENYSYSFPNEDYYADEPLREGTIYNSTQNNVTYYNATESSLLNFTESFTTATEESVLNMTAMSTENLVEYDEHSTLVERVTESETTTDRIEVSDFYTLLSGKNSSEIHSEETCVITQCLNMSYNEYVNTVGLKSTVVYEDELVPNNEGPSYMALIQSDYRFEKASSANLDIETRRKLRKLCWETMFGQELVKLTMMDLVLTIMATLFTDFFRAVFVRFMNRCWCWDLEKKFPQYGDFKIAENILHLVNNQGMVWMGMFFSPGLVVLNLIKLVIIMYLRSWAVMTCNVPHEVVFRASRSNNFYLALLLTMLFLCVLPVGYAIVWVEPSWHCGPFSNYRRIYHLFTQSLLKFLPESFHKALDYIASPGIIIPLLVLLILIIYYLLSLTGALREANNDLKIQLRRERTEERRKMFQMADKRGRGGSNELENTPFAKWKKILPVMPTNKSGEGKNDPANNMTSGDKTSPEKKDLLAKIVKTAFRKSSGTSDDESCLAVPPVDDETDTDFHESLPEDVLTAKDITFTPKPKIKHIFDISNTKTHIENEHVKKPTKVKKVSLKDRHLDDNIVKEQETNKKSLNLHLKNDNKEKPKESQTKAFKPNRPQFPQQYKPEIIAEHQQSHREFKRSISDDEKPRQFIISNVPEEEIGTGLSKRDFEMRSGHHYRMKSHQGSLPASIEDRQNSITSIIPVITISKTESDEDVLDDNGHNSRRVKKKYPKSPAHGEKSSSKSANKKHESQDNTAASTSSVSPNKTLKRQKSVEADRMQRDHHEASSSRTPDDEFDYHEKEKKNSKVKDELVRTLLKAAKEWRDGKHSPNNEKH